MLVNPKDGLDELSNTCENDITWISKSKIKRLSFHPREVGIELTKLENLMVDSKEGSIRDTLQVIYGVADKPKQDIAILNASALVIGKESKLQRRS